MKARHGAYFALLVTVLTGFFLGVATPAESVEWNRRWWVGARIADYLPADEQKGGFRLNQQTFGVLSTRDVKPKEVVYGSLNVGRGLKKFGGTTAFRSPELTLELEISRISTEAGNESGWSDDNASTRIALPGNDGMTRRDGDEDFVTFPVGDLTLTPAFANVLFHWGNARADFHAGVGLGVVFAEIEPSRAYLEFTGTQGPGDVDVNDAFGVNFKVGSNFRLGRESNLFMFIDAQFYSTQLFGSEAQVRWTGTVQEDGGNGVFLGERSYDVDGDGSPDETLQADLHVVDPGSVRLDGASIGVGIRYRFGAGKKQADAASE